jgi:hypothetical protein
MVRTLTDLGYKKEEEVYCAECGTNIRWWIERKHIAYHLCNDDIVCSTKCLKEYAIGYFSTDDIIKKEKSI